MLARRYYCIAAATATIAALLVGCRPDEPTAPRGSVERGATLLTTAAAGPSVISFRSNRDGDFDIYEINPDGTGELNLTNNATFDGGADWSPDRTKVVYTSEPDGPGSPREIMVMNADGSGQRRLTNSPDLDLFPRWAPNGLQIAFNSSPVMPGGHRDIIVMKPDGSEQTNLTSTPGDDESLPIWSPDGSQIAFIWNEQQIWVMNRDGTHKNMVFADGLGVAHLAWSPDGSRFAFLKSRDEDLNLAPEVYAINVDGTGLTNLTQSREFESGPVLWSPDGSKILFERVRSGEPLWELWAMNADGSRPVNLTNLTGLGATMNEVWSPDGSEIALASDPKYNGDPGFIPVLNIYLIRADGSAKAQVTNTTTAGFSSYSELEWVLKPVAPPGSTPAGTDVPVSPTDETTGEESPIDLVFETVTGSGTTTVSSGTVGGGGGPPPPANFRLGSPPTYYDIESTASYSGAIRICLTYTGVSYGNESNLKLLHGEKDASGNIVRWVDVTTSLNTDTDVICGEVTTLSPFLVAEENVAPVVTGISLPAAPIALGQSASMSASFTDANPSDVHTATIDWEDGTSPGAVAEASRSVSGTRTYAQAGVYTIGVTVSDGELSGSRFSVFDVPSYIVVYDPSAGFVTGGGWITSPAGAYVANPALTGKAIFGFVSRYKQGAGSPSGTTEFQFTTANLTFRSSSYQWLVVAGSRAQY